LWYKGGLNEETSVLITNIYTRLSKHNKKYAQHGVIISSSAK